jgi:UDP-N-acetyl-D-glucosamine dehydrogenase
VARKLARLPTSAESLESLLHARVLKGWSNERASSVAYLAQEIDDGISEYVAARAAEILNDTGRPMKDARVLILGVTYKPDVNEVRESPALPTMRALARRGADGPFHDPFVHWVELNGSSLERQGLDVALAEADLVVLLTPHASYDLEHLAEWASLVSDTRNAYHGERPPNVEAL